MHGRSVLVLLVLVAVPACATSTPSPSNAPAPVVAPRSEPPARPRAPFVCPVLSVGIVIPFWEGEGLWPDCPIASPIASVAGRCVDGIAGCMTPCAFEYAAADGEPRRKGTFDYDASGRLVGATMTSLFGMSPHVDTYRCKRDEAGHLTSCSGTKTVEWTYEAGRPVRSRHSSSGGSTFEFTYAHDERGRLITKTSDDGKQVSAVRYTYDADGLLTHQIVTVGQQTYDHAFTYANGRLMERNMVGSGTKSHNSGDRFEYDRDGRVITQTQTGADPKTYRFTYDTRGRLTTVVEDLGDRRYTETYNYSCK